MMKWAIYSFIEDNSIEIGESSWIVGEDKETFTNDEWLFAKQVIVRWPKDAKYVRKLPKSTVDISEIETQVYGAYVVKFSGMYLLFIFC